MHENFIEKIFEHKMWIIGFFAVIFVVVLIVAIVKTEHYQTEEQSYRFYPEVELILTQPILDANKESLPQIYTDFIVHVQRSLNSRAIFRFSVEDPESGTAHTDIVNGCNALVRIVHPASGRATYYGLCFKNMNLQQELIRTQYRPMPVALQDLEQLQYTPITITVDSLANEYLVKNSQHIFRLVNEFQSKLDTTVSLAIVQSDAEGVIPKPYNATIVGGKIVNGKRQLQLDFARQSFWHSLFKSLNTN